MQIIISDSQLGQSKLECLKIWDLESDCQGLNMVLQLNCYPEKCAYPL